MDSYRFESRDLEISTVSVLGLGFGLFLNNILGRVSEDRILCLSHRIYVVLAEEFHLETKRFRVGLHLGFVRLLPKFVVYLPSCITHNLVLQGE